MKHQHHKIQSFLSLVLAFALCLTMAAPAFAAGAAARTAVTASDLSGTYRVALASDDTQRVGPSQDSVTAGTACWMWIQDKDTYESHAARMYKFTATGESDGSVYWECLTNSNLVVQAPSTAGGVSLAEKNASEPRQRWMIEKDESTGVYTLKCGDLYLNSTAWQAASVAAEPMNWKLLEVEPEISLSLSASRVALNAADKTVTATVAGTDSNFAVIADTSAATFTSSNTNVATVSGSTITAVGEGETTITAKLTVDGKECTATAKLTVVGTIDAPSMDGIYFITDSVSGRDLESGADGIFAGYQMYSWNTNMIPARLWVFPDAGDGYVYWKPLSNSGLCWTVSGSNLILTAAADNANNKWEIIPTGVENQYKIRNVGSNVYVKDPGGQALTTTTSNEAQATAFHFAEQANILSFSTSAAFVGQEIANVAAATNPNTAVTVTSDNTSVAEIKDGTTVVAKAKGTATLTATAAGLDSVTCEFTVLGSPAGWEAPVRIDGAVIGGIFEPSGNSGTGNIRVDNELYNWSNGLANYRTYRFSDAGDGYVYWHFDYNPNIVIAAASETSVLQKAVVVGSDAQKWKLIPVEGKEGVYLLQNKEYGTYIATQGDTANAKIILADDTSLESVQWDITSLIPTLILTAPAGDIAPGAVVKASVAAKDAFGTGIEPTVTITSSRPEVVKLADASAEAPAFAGSVSFTGQKVPQILISGEAAGTALITASMTYEGVAYTAEAEITVSPDAAPFTGDEWYKAISTPEVNREPSHADFFPYQSVEAAVAAEKSALDDVNENSSRYYKLLSQTDWDFAMVENPAAAEQADAAGWLDTALPSGQAEHFVPEFVPAEWQAYKNADGTFKYDEPVYTNSYYPWGSIPGNGTPNYADPQAPTYYNPVGYYRTTFQTPADWDGRNIFISFQGVKSAYYVYVNGKPVGYSTDSFSAHDFNLTEYLNPAGEDNTLAVKVFRFSIGSYLENQDMIQGSGIIRDVFLYSKDAKAEIRDFFVQTSFADRTSVDSDVTMTVDVDVRNLTNADLTDGYTVELALRTLDGDPVGAPAILTYDTLTALDGDTWAADIAKQSYDLEKKINLGDRKTATIQVSNPDKWFPDTPNLYMLTIALKDKDGNVVEATAQRVGFREIYKVNINEDGQEQMQITGQKLIFRGVNRHDTDPYNGHAVTRQNILDDLLLMKQFNVNAVRTSHYPNNRYLYDLADELGIYIYAEANVESHMGGYDNAGSASAIPGSDARWVWPVMDRNMNMVELLKNHASIIGWSYSNESTYTSIEWTNDYCFWATAMAVLERDPSRLRMYERENHNYYHSYVKDNNDDDPWSIEHRAKNIIDVHATQYPAASAVQSWAQNSNNKLPYFEQEYQHAMGQSFGSFNEFWKLNRTMPNVQGGFIWDWMDQTRVTTRVDEDGNATTFWGYGGDWIDTVTNADAFCANGVINADRTPSSRAIQMRYDHQQVSFYPVDDSGNRKTDYQVTDKTLKFRVVNEYENTSLSAFHITWTLLADVEVLGSGTLDLSTAPMTRTAAAEDFSVDFSSDIVTITLPDVTPEAGVNYLLNFSVENKVRPNWDTSVVEYDNVVAYDQFDLTPTGDHAVERTALNLDTMNGFTSVENSGELLKVSGVAADGGLYAFQMDKTTGIISNYTLNGKVVLEKGPVPSFWRAMTYNDSCTNYIPALRNPDDTMELNSAPVITVDEESGKHIRVELDVKLPVDATQKMTYDIYANGEIVVSSVFTPNSDFANGAGNWTGNTIPKIGLRMTVAPGYENLEYLGRGPDETYIDRKTASRVGLYQSTVDEQFITQYLKPQENGNRTDVRWTSLTNEQGEGLLVVADGTVESSALHVKAENLNPSDSSAAYDNQPIRHSTEVPMDEQTYWCIDAIQRGVSNTGFFGHAPLPGFYPTTTGTPTYSETFRIVPVDSSTDKLSVGRLGFTADNLGGDEPAMPHSVTVNAALAGIVTASKNSARPNETITLIVAEGYQLKTGTVKVNGEALEANEAGIYTFTMPAADVEITAEYELISLSVTTNLTNLTSNAPASVLTQLPGPLKPES